MLSRILSQPILKRHLLSSHKPVLIRARTLIGRNESPMKMRNVLVTLAVIWGGFYGLVQHSNAYREEQERIDKVIFSRSGADRTQRTEI